MNFPVFWSGLVSRAGASHRVSLMHPGQKCPRKSTKNYELFCSVCIKNVDVNVTCGVIQQVLNEVVVDRGPSSYLTNLEIYCNDHHITSVQGDGEMQCLQYVCCPSFCDL